jgi:hypothetical protein
MPAGRQGIPGSRPAHVRARFAGALAFVMTAVAGTALSVLSAAADLAPGPSIQEVVDPQGRFTIDFPRDWAVRRVDGSSLGLGGVAAHDAVIGFGPAGADGRRINVIVDVRTLPAPVSPEGAATYAEAGLRRLPGYRSLNAGPYTLGGVAAYYRFFSHVDDGARVYQLQMYVTQGTQFYVLSGATRTGHAQIRPDMRVIVQIIDTFRAVPQYLRIRISHPGTV